MDYQDSKRFNSLCEAAIEQTVPTNWHRCFLHLPFLCRELLAALPVSRPEFPLHFHSPQTETSLSAQVFASSVGQTRLWSPKSAFPHCKWLSYGWPMSFVNSRWGSSGGPRGTSLAYKNQPPISSQDENKDPVRHEIHKQRAASDYLPQSYSCPEHNTNNQITWTSQPGEGQLPWESTFPPVKLKSAVELFPLWNDTEKNKMCLQYILINSA